MTITIKTDIVFLVDSNNIVIKPVDGANVSIIFKGTAEGFYIYKGENITTFIYTVVARKR